MICVDIDEITPCLKDSVTGEIIDTEVIRVRRKSFLQKYNKKNGWYVAWDSLVKDYEIYGYDCEMMGFAANSQLEEHYVNSFGAIRIHMLHPYQILIPAESGHQIKEVYTYEWTDEEL